jgi:hypothetical protein
MLILSVYLKQEWRNIMTNIMKRSSTRISVEPKVVWGVISDGFLDISKWAGGVKSSKANPETPSGFNGSKYGGRVCDVEGVGITDERIVSFDNETMTLTYTVKAKKLPFFVNSLKNSWKVTKDINNESIVQVTIEAETKGLTGKIGAIPMGKMLEKGAQGLPNDLKTYIEKSL